MTDVMLLSMHPDLPGDAFQELCERALRVTANEQNQQFVANLRDRFERDGVAMVLHHSERNGLERIAGK